MINEKYTNQNKHVPSPRGELVSAEVPQSVSKYVTLPPDVEVSLGHTISARRAIAKQSAGAVLASLPEEERKKLSYGQKKTYWKRIARADPLFIEARDQLAESHLPLAHAIVDYETRHYLGLADRDDFEQTASATTFESAELYDVNKGVSFASYIFTAVRRAKHVTVDQHNTLHISAEARGSIGRIFQAEELLLNTLQRPPTAAEIADEVNKDTRGRLKIDAITIEAIKQNDIHSIPIVLSGTIDEARVQAEKDGWDNGSLKEPFVTEEGALVRLQEVTLLERDPVEIIEARDEVRFVSNNLSEREKTILWERIIEERTYNKIADEQGISRERVWQIMLDIQKKAHTVAPEIEVFENRTFQDNVDRIRRSVIEGRVSLDDVVRVMGKSIARLGEMIDVPMNAAATEKLPSRPRVDDQYADLTPEQISQLLDERDLTRSQRAQLLQKKVWNLFQKGITSPGALAQRLGVSRNSVDRYLANERKALRLIPESQGERPPVPVFQAKRGDLTVAEVAKMIEVPIDVVKSIVNKVLDPAARDELLQGEGVRSLYEGLTKQQRSQLLQFQAWELHKTGTTGYAEIAEVLDVSKGSVARYLFNERREQGLVRQTKAGRPRSPRIQERRDVLSAMLAAGKKINAHGFAAEHGTTYATVMNDLNEIKTGNHVPSAEPMYVPAQEEISHSGQSLFLRPEPGVGDTTRKSIHDQERGDPGDTNTTVFHHKTK